MLKWIFIQNRLKTISEKRLSNSYPSSTAIASLISPAGRWTNQISDNKTVAISRTFRFKYFKHAWAFMTRVAEECQTWKHHPEWSNTYNVVFVRWTSHKTGMISEKDIAMAEFCDRAAKAAGEVDADHITSTEEPKMKSLADATSQKGCAACIPWTAQHQQTL